MFWQNTLLIPREVYHEKEKNSNSIHRNLQFRHYRAKVGQEIVGGLLSMQRVESGFDSEKVGGNKSPLRGMGFLNGDKRTEGSATVIGVSSLKR